MEKLLVVVNGLIDSLIKAKEDVAKLIADYNKEREKQAIEWGDIKTAREDLAKREKAVVEIENIVVLEQSAKETQKQATEGLSALEKERNDFNAYRTAEQKKISLAQDKIEQENKGIQKEYEVLKKAQDKFAKEKEDYKVKIAKGIVDIADKK